ncbi:hypothetical protein B9Z55_006993 [Caenorhabditis nigoni]|uniref:F-box associated domain-containing protein n=1 Tax=Caenorhabditis nigoni TaxID=1611254 RepID=A0A2G5V7P7_9PELO|nr:hypothetical protein B9Z55_006993 [Caenorhabditis nigoni]
MHVVSYPVLRSILEHIEANCRLSLSARCPEISRVEKSIPLRVDRINFYMKNMMNINDCSYSIYFERPKRETWRNSDRTSNQRLMLQLENFKSKFSAKKYFSKNYKIGVATRKVFGCLLGERSKVQVNLLIVSNGGGHDTMQYLSRLSNMKVSALESWGIRLVKYHQLIKSPRKQLELIVPRPIDFEKPILRTAEKIVMRIYEDNEPNIWLDSLRNLHNKEVIIDTCIRGLTDISIMELMEYWRETRRAVGSSFSVRKGNGDSIEMFLRNVKERFQGTYVKWKETNSNNLSAIYAVSIKVDSESSIVVCGDDVYSWLDKVSKKVVTWPAVVIKVMATEEFAGVTEPLEESHIISALVVFSLLAILIKVFIF